jgi:hypothetical protein
MRRDGEEGVVGSQPMSTTHGVQINFGDLTPYVTYGTNRHLFVPDTPVCIVTVYPVAVPLILYVSWLHGKNTNSKAKRTVRF